MNDLDILITEDHASKDSAYGRITTRANAQIHPIATSESNGIPTAHADGDVDDGRRYRRNYARMNSAILSWADQTLTGAARTTGPYARFRIITDTVIQETGL